MPVHAKTAHHRAKVARITQQIAAGERPTDDPELFDEKRGLAAAKIELYILKVLDAAPPLTPEQLTKLAELLRPVRGIRRD